MQPSLSLSERDFLLIFVVWMSLAVILAYIITHSRHRDAQMGRALTGVELAGLFTPQTLVNAIEILLYAKGMLRFTTVKSSWWSSTNRILELTDRALQQGLDEIDQWAITMLVERGKCKPLSLAQQQTLAINAAQIGFAYQRYQRALRQQGLLRPAKEIEQQALCAATPFLLLILSCMIGEFAIEAMPAVPLMLYCVPLCGAYLAWHRQIPMTASTYARFKHMQRALSVCALDRATLVGASPELYASLYVLNGYEILAHTPVSDLAEFRMLEESRSD
jgi:uncharacterized protein (TIGR04222 family)